MQAALDGELASLSSKRLAISAADLSNRYRARRSSSGGSFLRTREEIAAYAAYRLPATFAAVHSALGQVQDRLPDWSPQTLLDVGAGPGTAMWAAATIWPDIGPVTLLEREEAMIALGKRLARHSSLASVQEAEWREADLAGTWATPPHDLVIAAYVLGELPQDSSVALIRRLWESTSGTLVVIEPGTPSGFSRIRQVREQLLVEGAKMIAPCPHGGPCPMSDNDWCHFAQRISRSRLHRQVKAGALSYEDEKFSFVGVSRAHEAPVQGRVIRHPQVRAGHIHFEICTPKGLMSIVATRKDRDLFRVARDLQWGSAVPFAMMDRR